MSDLQFDKAEYAGAGPQCAVCAGPLGSPWWSAGTAKVCARCKAGLEAQLDAPIGVSGYVKAGAAGLGISLACAAVWAAIQSATGAQWGIVAIGVGWAIAEGMRRVAGQGSRLLQVLGLAFVYLAVSCASVPLVADEADGSWLAWVVAVPVSFLLPFIVWQGGLSSILWYVIVFFGFSRAWTGLASGRVAFAGPFHS